MFKYLFFFLSSTSVFAQTINEEHQLLWEISGNGLKEKSYLFGSLHSNDRRFFDLTDSTYVALSKTNAVALEVDVFNMFDELDTRRGRLVLKYDSQGQPYTAQNNSSRSLYGDEDGMPQFLDAYFEQYCHNAGKRFFPLETAERQLNLFSDIELPNFSELRLEAMLIAREDLEELYLKGDIYGLDELMRVNLSLSDGLYDKVITDRNREMAARLDSIMKSGNAVFCAVGAGHLAGGTGMITMLRGKGYNVRKVMATYSDEVGIAELEVKSKRFYTYENDSLGFFAQFPGKPQEILDDWDGSDLKLLYRDLGQGNTYSIEVHPLTDDRGLEDLAEIYIASPSESPAERITLSNGGEAYQGISDSYPEGLSWTRVVMGQDYFLLLKAYGGNKFMNSPRAKRFFDNVSFGL